MHKGHKHVAIGELCEFINGNGFRPPDWKSSGLPIIRIQNLNGSQTFNYFDGVPKDKWIVEPGDLLFAWAGVKGVSFGPTIWPGPRGVLNQHIFRVVPKTGIDRYWVYFALRMVTQRIEENAHGFKASLVHVRRDDITDQVVDLPPIEEQREISKVLRTWSEAITKSEALIEMLGVRREALRSRLIREADTEAKRTTFDTFLSESRIPGADGASARKITVKLYGKGAVAKDEKRDGSATTQYYRRRAGQLIYSKLDFLNGAFAIVPSELDRFESTLDLPAFDISEQVNPRWLIAHLTRRSYYENQLHLARGQRKARRIAPEDFLASPIYLPSREMQDKIADLLAVAEREITSNRKLLKALMRQERGLIQKLITGEWRVKVDSDKQAAA
jgi:type I restriction enzyme S subunit